MGRQWIVFTTVMLAALPSSAQEVRRNWESEWEVVVEAAKKEGQVSIYAGVNPAAIINAGAFQKRLPEIKLTQVLVARAFGAVPRILSERRAGRYLADIVMLGGVVDRELYQAKVLDPIKPLLVLPEVVDESKWWLSRHPYGDPERKYSLRYIGAPKSIEIYYNTRATHPKEFRTLFDILNPKWKGKIVTYDMRAGGAGGGTMRFIYHHPKLGPDFIKRLFGKMDITLTRDGRQAIDWLATGKYPVCFICNYSDVERAKRQGLPVDIFSFGAIEGVAGIAAESGSISLLSRAPHPNAARVFINWLLSQEGQITAQRVLSEQGSQALDSLRIDIPKDDIPPHLRRVEGVQYIDLDDPGQLDMRPIFKVIEEALVESRRKH